MPNPGFICYLIIIANLVVSYRGFKDEYFQSQYDFQVEKVSVYKQYYRLFTSGFLHVNWLHLIFNMLALYLFSGNLTTAAGSFFYLFIYCASLVCGNLFALYVHRYDSGYTSVGASGAVFGIMFSAIALFPGMKIGLLFLPISFPSWLFGLAFILFTIYSMKKGRRGVGYDAHFAGAVAGLLLTLIFNPSVVLVNYVPILVILIPAAIFLIVMIRNPAFLLTDRGFRKKSFLNRENKYNLSRHQRELEIDEILEKIHKKGIKSLSKEEKEKLNKYSQSV